METTKIKFRVWNGMEMIYDVTVGKFGAFYVNPGDKGDGLDPKDSASLTPFNTKYSDTCPVMQFTGLHDKNGKEIYEGDRIKVRYVAQTYQTHSGDNIPHGSYTEPDVSVIVEDEYNVIFKAGAWRIEGESDIPDGVFIDLLSDVLTDFYSYVFNDMDDNYFEDEGFKMLEELKSTIGVEVIGHIYSTN